MSGTPPPSLPKPFLKWVGSKRQLVPALCDHVPATLGRYREPFLGGGALFFHLAKRGRISRGATLSDANERLVRTWRAVRDQVDRLVALLEDAAAAYAADPEGTFRRIRATDPDGLSDADVGAWFIFLNRTAYNGLYRVNASGWFNAPFGRYAKPRICDRENLARCAELLQGVELRHEDFGTAMLRAEPGDFVYADPPYVPISETSSFTAYTPGGFGLEQHARLRDTARVIRARGAEVLLSNSAAEAVRELYADGFALHDVRAARAVACHPESRGKVREFLIVPT